MSHFFEAHQALDGFHGLAGSRLPEFAAAPNQDLVESIDRGSIGSELTIGQLDAAVRQVFGGRDQILFELADTMPTCSGAESLRCDSAHGAAHNASSLKRLMTALGLAKAKQMLCEDDWVVLVADESTLDLAQAAQLPQQFEQVRRFLLIWCGSTAARTPANYLGDAAARRGSASSSAAVNVFAGDFDQARLVAELTRLKDQSVSAILDVRSRQSFVGHSLVAVPTDTAIDFARPANLTSEGPTPATAALLRLAADDPRTMVVSLAAGAELALFAARYPDRFFEIPTGDSDALVWCAGLAAGGCRPLLVASGRGLAGAWASLAAEICAPQHLVKLLVLGSSDETDFPSSRSLSLLRLLPDTPLLVPRDTRELGPMISFAAAYDGPAALWLSAELQCLPDAESAVSGRAVLAFEAGDQRQAEVEAGSRIQLGRADVQGAGADVVLLAWGDLVAAADRARVLLAGVGVRAAVLNARFLQPLDEAAIVAAAGGAQVCVVLDDRRLQSGFAATVMERLAAAGSATPASVLFAAPDEIALDVPSAREHFALRIFDHCRWLAEPTVPSWSTDPIVPSLPSDACKSVNGKWLGFSPERGRELADEREQVFARQLTAAIRKWADAYEEVGTRDVYLWRWCLHGVELTTLPCVAPALRAHVCDTKVLSIVLCVLLDDVADQHGKSQLLETLLGLTSWGEKCSLAGLNDVERRHAELTRALWEEYLARIATYPCFDAYDRILRFDLEQVFNALRYSHLVNSTPSMLNLVEHDLYMPHNMMMVSFATLDLMCSPGFDQSELGALREVMRHTESMGRIGNLLSTWRRELADRDFTSGVFARAIIEQDLTLDELEHADAATIEHRIRSRGHEEYFSRQWHEHREQSQAKSRRLRSLDLRQTLAGHDRFFSMYLGSQGLI
jgi:transketolase C-terminal domain/subunit